MTITTYQETGPYTSPAYVAVPAWLRLQGVSDRGMVAQPCRCAELYLELPCQRSCAELAWEHLVDVHRGHLAAEAYLLANGYHPSRGVWIDGEGYLVDRWVRFVPPKTVRGATRARLALERARRRRSA